MEKKKIPDDHEVEPAAHVRVDRFGFVNQAQNSGEGLTSIRSASEYERYAFHVKDEALLNLCFPVNINKMLVNFS